MSSADRVYKIDALIRRRGHVSFAALLDELEVSPATLKRDFARLRDRLGAPLRYDPEVNGYRIDGAAPTGGSGAAAAGEARHELPGLWFDEQELYAMLMAHQLLSSLGDDGLLGRHLQPMLARIHEMLGPGGASDAKALMQRVRIVAAQRRAVPSRAFERIGRALVQRHRVRMVYLTRRRGTTSEREVSPQRLVHYRATWYLDAWCHTRERLLRFALDAVQDATVLPTKARTVPMADVEAAMDAGYGIFAGGRKATATLRFSATAANWVRHERWHDDQQGELLADGRYVLKLPYVDETELAMDILRQGEDVEVLSPPSLRAAVQRRLRAACALYDDAEAVVRGDDDDAAAARRVSRRARG